MKPEIAVSHQAQFQPAYLKIDPTISPMFGLAATRSGMTKSGIPSAVVVFTVGAGPRELFAGLRAG
ncbi:MAG: hypothetical protein A3G07_01950 [Candidatus Doudnabacteria bacterium RIFCSPLOWO2_12_FULL_47_12]|nr:MAG: hypothetical protein A3G07_01950 [Candidatus Doudnabacteria bacterium RIFCSPLOWO2_12_FULL_47_12]